MKLDTPTGAKTAHHDVITTPRKMRFQTTWRLTIDYWVQSRNNNNKCYTLLCSLIDSTYAKQGLQNIQL